MLDTKTLEKYISSKKMLPFRRQVKNIQPDQHRNPKTNVEPLKLKKYIKIIRTLKFLQAKWRHDILEEIYEVVINFPCVQQRTHSR